MRTQTKRALITGIAGQDGSYLAELLLTKGYEVFGVERVGGGGGDENLEAVNGQLKFVEGDILNDEFVKKVVGDILPDEIYNLAGQSSVSESWKNPAHTMRVNALLPLHLMCAMREVHHDIKLFQASSAEMFGNVDVIPQTETTPYFPRNPYGVSKLAAYWMGVNYRESHKLFIANGILFNHESERRRIEFVARKITDGLARIALGKSEILTLGNIDSMRDWGYAPDYVEAMWKILQHETPDDYIIATGEAHSVREFIEEAGRVLGMNIVWKGSSTDEVGTDTVSGKTIITIDSQFYRPTEARIQLGDPTKARTKLGWSPKVNFKELVHIMTEADLGRIKKSA